MSYKEWHCTQNSSRQRCLTCTRGQKLSQISLLNMIEMITNISSYLQIQVRDYRLFLTATQVKRMQLIVLGQRMLKRQWDLQGNWKQILDKPGSSLLGPPAASPATFSLYTTTSKPLTLLLLLPCWTCGMALNTYLFDDASWLPIRYTLIVNAVQKPNLHGTTIIFIPIFSIWLLCYFNKIHFPACRVATKNAINVFHTIWESWPTDIVE